MCRLYFDSFKITRKATTYDKQAVLFGLRGDYDVQRLTMTR